MRRQQPPLAACIIRAHLRCHLQESFSSSHDIHTLSAESHPPQEAGVGEALGRRGGGAMEVGGIGSFSLGSNTAGMPLPWA